jgi:hypothetical protein
MQKTITRSFPILLLLFIFLSVQAQSDVRPIAKSITDLDKGFDQVPIQTVFTLLPEQSRTQWDVENEVSQAEFFSLDNDKASQLTKQAPELLRLNIPQNNRNDIMLNLKRAKLFANGFQLYAASDRENPYPFQSNTHYWGIVGDDAQSLVAISIIDGEIMGFISQNGETYTIGKLRDGTDGIHIIYKTDDLKIAPNVGCDTDDVLHYIGSEKNNESRSVGDCVQEYIEVDYDIFLGKGGVTQAADYVAAVFSQVAILYANDGVDFTVSEIVVWDVVDPYTGPTTSNFLTQFRNYLGGNYNGDLAHLVGYTGSGGIAYVDVLCNAYYGVGYSDINPTYSNVPAYSWTVEVVTHEIGHNMGSPHTHACAWNGNNTAIDGCGPAAGYSEGCNGPIPTKGTIMSYCHLVSGVGIDFNLGFGPQPTALIQGRINNASCLASCQTNTDDAGISAITQPTGSICASSVIPIVELSNYGTNDLTSVTINYQLDGGTINTYDWTGTLATNASTSVFLPSITFAVGNHDFNAFTSDPNGLDDEDPSNDDASSSFDRPADQLWYADNDEDGYGDPNVSVTDCAAPNGYVSDNTDCNDNSAAEYPGATCDDGDDCTLNDILDSNCGCAGTYSGDSDGDGVCDALDICPGGDDNIDTDGDGIPDDCDCNLATANFSPNPLTHVGSGSSSSSASMASGSSDPEFTISGLDAKTGGKPSDRYIEEVTVTYVDGNGITQTYGTFSGDAVSSINVSISGVVTSIQVDLADGYEGDAGSRVLSVDLTTVNYCNGCADSDGDGVCDDDDACPGFDDNLLGASCDDGDPCTIDDIYVDCDVCSGTESGDTDLDGICDAIDNCPDVYNPDQADSNGNGIGDACEPGGCPNEITEIFNVNPLTHTGTGSSSSTATLTSSTSDISFTVSNLGAKTNGNPSNQYIEAVLVEYVDENGVTISYGEFFGDVQSTVEVAISEVAQSVIVTLYDGLDGDSGSKQLSIDMTAISGCQTSPMPQSLTQNASVGIIKMYPNPANEEVFLRFIEGVVNAEIVIHNVLGSQIASYQMESQDRIRIDLRSMDVRNQLLFVSIYKDGNMIETRRLLVLDK